MFPDITDDTKYTAYLVSDAISLIHRGRVSQALDLMKQAARLLNCDYEETGIVPMDIKPVRKGIRGY